MTSCILAFSSSSVLPWECAPGKPGTYPTYVPVSGQRSMMAVKFLMPLIIEYFPFDAITLLRNAFWPAANELDFFGGGGF